MNLCPTVSPVTDDAVLSAAIAASPFVRQYFAVREKLGGNAVLLYKLGAFYEVVGPDAAAAAAILGVPLTKRVGIPMCGVPYHDIARATKALAAAGKAVGTCEEVRR